ncbi:hypothetical protein GOV12_07100, partial [Candidatus Pacearchaeota archaeon]|nr:hypothetical protein [Candidatus Pacearchaeota archaeon]
MSKKVIAVDIGGSNLRVAIVENNKIIRYVKNKTPKNFSEFKCVLVNSIDGLFNTSIK